MYVPAHFALSTQDCVAILARLGAADLVTVHEDGPDATYLPWEYVGSGAALPGGGAPGPLGSLIGHVARNNPQGMRTPVAPALVIAHAGDHYVSPMDLPSRTEHGKIVPTWDYITVHAHGELVRHDDPEWILASMRVLTERHERSWAAKVACTIPARTGPARTIPARTGPAQPDPAIPSPAIPGPAAPDPAGAGGRTWSVADPPAEFVDRMVRAVVGLELRITRLVGKAKMSQNKAPADVEGEIAALQARGMDELAAFKREVSLPAAVRRHELLADVGRRYRARQ